MAAKLRLGAKGIVPDEIVWEILKWLPTKSLMRFKVVSKLWLSIILDPNFAREHRSPFRGGLLMNPNPTQLLRRQPIRDFFIANLGDALGSESSNDAKDVNVSFQFRIPEDIRGFHATNMVNGIICFYDRNVAKLCNIATREIINLPESRCDYKYCKYHLGFDPIQSVFKLLKICPIHEEEKYLYDSPYRLEPYYNIRSIECEILTLGVDSSWRSINPPPNIIIPHGLCIDGVLYWMTLVKGLEGVDYLLISFHLAGEKFQSIHKPHEFWDVMDDMQICLFQFETSLALAECCWHWPYYLISNHEIMITQYREGSWTEMKSYNLPKKEMKSYNFDQGISFIVVRGSFSNGNLMMYSEQEDGLRKDGMIYLFDQTRNYIKKLKLRIPASDIPLSGRLCWYEENIVSLKRLMGFPLNICL